MAVKKTKDKNGAGVPTKYIKQPYPVSEVRGDFTVQQTHILIEMMEQLQDKMEQRMNEGQLLLFKDEDFDDNGRIHIDVKFSDVASRPDYYKEVEMLADRMMQMYIKSETEENGDGMVELEHFVSAVKYTKQGSRRNFIRFSFDKVQAKQLFNMARYSKYLKAVAKGAKNRYTARLYMLMTSTRKFGVWNIRYDELRKILGCDDYDEKSKSFVCKKYPLYKSFKMAVLKTAEKELKALADAGESDCWFEYREHLPNGKSTGAPEILEFIIHTTSMGEIEDAKAAKNMGIMEIEKVLKEYGLKSADVKQIVDRLGDGDVKHVLDVIRSVIERVDKSDDVKDRRAYMVASLKNALIDTEVNTSGTVAVDTSGTVAMSKTAENGKAVTLKEEEVSEQTKADFYAALNKISPEWRDAFQLYGSKNGIPVILMPSATTRETFEKCGGSLDAFTETLGEIKISYKTDSV